MSLTTTNQHAADAIREHHAELAATLRERVTALMVVAQAQQPHADAHQAVVQFLDTELLPHAHAEEQALYPAGDTGPTAMLVRSMRDEHVNLVAHVDSLRTEADAVAAACAASAILALFESHLHKENDLLIPALVADPSISLADLLGGMHELLG
jgi:iron-sulfur cluster repair protein YtfE (RIC family)